MGDCDLVDHASSRDRRLAERESALVPSICIYWNPFYPFENRWLTCFIGHLSLLTANPIQAFMLAGLLAKRFWYAEGGEGVDRASG